MQLLNKTTDQRIVHHGRTCKALGYLGGALKLTPNTDTILAESARAAADFARERTLTQLGTEMCLGTRLIFQAIIGVAE